MNKESELRFSIRKLTVGAVSVMFGALIFGVSVNQVHADEQTTGTPETVQQPVSTETPNTDSSQSVNNKNTQSVDEQTGELLVDYDFPDQSQDSRGIETTIGSHTFKGKIGEEVPFSEIKEYVPDGYYLNENVLMADPQHRILSKKPVDGQTSKAVYIISKLKQGNRNYKRIIHYMLEDGGASTGKTAPTDVIQNITVGMREVKDSNYNPVIQKDPINVSAVPTPKIDGYTADITVVPAKEIAGGIEKITKLFESEVLGPEHVYVVYHLNTQVRKISYVDVTNDSKEVGSAYVSGSIKTSVSFDAVKNLPFGYALTDNEGNVFPIYLDFKNPVVKINVTPLKTAMSHAVRVIHYQKDDGTKAFDDHIDSFIFAKKQFVDKQTGHAKWSNWLAESTTFKSVDSPELEGYKPDIAQVPEMFITAEMGLDQPKDEMGIPTIKKEITVIYTKNKPSQPDEPSQPTNEPTQPTSNVQPKPQEPTTPDTPDTPNIPNEPEETVKPHATDTNTDTDSGKKVAKPGKTKSTYSVRPLATRVEKHVASNNKQLPQTGDTINKAGLVGLLAAGLGVLGLVADRKRKN